MSTLNPSPPCIEFLRAWEGPASLVPRFDAVSGKWDHGYGILCAPDAPAVTLQWCEDELRGHAAMCGEVVLNSMDDGVRLAQNEFDALVCFVYNVGAGRRDEPGKPGKDGFVTLRNGRPSTMLRLLNEMAFDEAAEQFDKWVYSAGKVIPGLKKRRAAERAMFERGDYSHRP